MENFNAGASVKADIGITHSGDPYFPSQDVRKSLKESALFFEVQQL